jgi:hypothetical protein
VATVWWTGNSINTSQVDTITVTAAANGGTLTATINGKAVVYTMTGTDTTATAAAAWQALLANTSAVPPEFNEVVWTVSGSAVTATAATPGVPFTLTATAAGGATLSQVHTQANVSQSDVGASANWSRAGTPAIPQNGDDVVIANSVVPLLWNLQALNAVTISSLTRFQSFTGTIGLPVNNPAGYLEYRPTSFQLGPTAGKRIVLGQQDGGTGPTRERYDFQSVNVAITVLASGPAADAYSVHLLLNNASTTLNLQNTSVGIATDPGESSTLASANVDGGGFLAMGQNVTMGGTLKLIGGSALLFDMPVTMDVQAGSGVTVIANALGSGPVSTSLTIRGGSRVTWIGGGTITSLTMELGSVLDKSQDLRALFVTNGTIDGDSCQVLDPNSAITWSNAITVRNGVQAGPFTFGPNRTVLIT